MRFTRKVMIGCGLLFMQTASAHGPLPPSMQGAPIPPVPGLLDGADPIIIDKDMAIALGKALFWDSNVGSDGMACASCHFHAGADGRVKNQINPGELSPAASGKTFEATASGGQGGPNYTLNRDDFPFYRFNDPLDNQSGVSFGSNDVVSSSGTFSGDFKSVSQSGATHDECERNPDPVYHVGAVGTRRVEPRNTPTVINAVFNHRNFWDGRANNVFNGSSPWGNRDPEAGVWVKLNARSVSKQRLNLINSSLASQAVGPPVNDTEMSCRKRIFPDLGRKLLMRRPLEHQKVHHEDSVLGYFSRSSSEELQPGLNTTYTDMIRKAFNQKYWSFNQRGMFGGPTGQLPYNQMEANFAMFFGLALQMYQSTLVSDQAPIDTSARDVDFFPTDLNPSERRGLDLFVEFHCNICHSGPALTSAALVTNVMMLEENPEAFGPLPISGQSGISRNVVAHDSTADGVKLMDFGYFNTGVADPAGDPGVMGKDDFGNPLSFTDQYQQYLVGNVSAVVDPGVTSVRSCDFLRPFAINDSRSNNRVFTAFDGVIPDPNGNVNCISSSAWAYIPTQEAAAAELVNPITKKMAKATRAAFKTPTLRNVELTGPYMHNGSMATLDQVVEFYARGGNFENDSLHFFLFPMADLQFDATARADLVAFLKTFTDERVRYERAPFDHPELVIPHGHKGDHLFAEGGNPLHEDLAKDEWMMIPAVGSSGRVEPILPFDQYLDD